MKSISCVKTFGWKWKIDEEQGHDDLNCIDFLCSDVNHYDGDNAVLWTKFSTGKFCCKFVSKAMSGLVIYGKIFSYAFSENDFSSRLPHRFQPNIHNTEYIFKYSHLRNETKSVDSNCGIKIL